MTPEFFGDADRRLFGIYHAPAPSEARDVGVVLCHAGPHEYRHTYFSFRRLAVLLAQAGLHAFRFDYGGTGDSAGDGRGETLARWAADVRSAARELKDVSGARRISLVGMRLGAAVAALAVNDGLRVDQLVLWEPVVDGRAYLAQLDELERQRLATLRYPQRWAPVDTDRLGYETTAEQRAELAALDVARDWRGTPRRATIVAAAATPAYERVRAAAEDAGVPAALQVVDDPGVRAGEAIANTLLAQSSLQEIVQALSTRRAG